MKNMIAKKKKNYRRPQLRQLDATGNGMMLAASGTPTTTETMRPQSDAQARPYNMDFSDIY